MERSSTFGVQRGKTPQFCHIQAAQSNAMCRTRTCQRLNRKYAQGPDMNNMFSAKSNEHLLTWVYIGSSGRVNSITLHLEGKSGDSRCLERDTGKTELQDHLAVQRHMDNRTLLDQRCFLEKEAIRRSKRKLSRWQFRGYGRRGRTGCDLLWTLAEGGREDPKETEMNVREEDRQEE